MEEIYAACIAYETCVLTYADFKRVTEPIWLLGKKYNVHDGDDFEKLNADIRSKLWFTYRKQFLSIGDTSLTSDSGWGCMHRCGQMVMAQTLILRYFGREWKWRPKSTEELYRTILNKFNDRAECQYSIHKISSTGCVLEKNIGQWFGPNTIVQVLKKLAEEDTETDIAIHVAMDNMVIKGELRRLFRRENKFDARSLIENTSNSTNTASSSQNIDTDENCLETVPISSESIRPILLTIPLRLGLCEIIPVYFEKLKGAFTLRQCVGMIGGRTNHASYFIGYVGDELIYLDPHTTQLHRSEEAMDDLSYHCDHPSRMNFNQLDPSIALCFYLKNEDDFENWCKDAQQVLLEPEKDALFEILEEKPPMLHYVDIDEDEFSLTLNEQDRIYTSDDEFELLM